MQAPILSILIPTLNAEKTLQSALDSVLQQQFTDWEILVIDSVSKDGTMDRVRALAAHDARVRFVSEPDKGIFDAMNKGVALARGQWIYFLGSDDTLYDPGVLQAFREDLAGGHFDLVYGNIVISRNGKPYDGVFDPEKILRKNMSHQAAFYRRELFERIGGFTIRYRAYADWDFNIRCFSDPTIRTNYLDRVVALFGMDGVSRRPDIVFLREVLVPANLKWLNERNPRYLRAIGHYDDWWRLLRNAKIRSLQELLEQAGGMTIPRSLGTMVRWQQRIPERLLLPGGFSKFFMLLSYLDSRMTRSI